MAPNHHTMRSYAPTASLLDQEQMIITREHTVMFLVCGPGSVVGIATAYGLDGPGIEYRWGGDFPRLYRPALGPTQPPVQWVQVKVKQPRYRPGVSQRVPGS